MSAVWGLNHGDFIRVIAGLIGRHLLSHQQEVALNTQYEIAEKEEEGVLLLSQEGCIL